MLTLSDINRETNSHDGDIYSDLYKDLYGSRPRYAQFMSVEDFQSEYDRLADLLTIQIDEEALQQEANMVVFLKHIDTVMETVQDCTRERAIEILAEAEDISKEDIHFYGISIIEHQFNLKYGSLR